MPCAARANLLICWKPTLPGSALPQMKAAARAALAAPITRASAALSMKNITKRLVRKGLVYPCFCSRSQLHAADAPHRSDGNVVYAGDLPEPDAGRDRSAHRQAQASLDG